jgi:hypothetical protein
VVEGEHSVCIRDGQLEVQVQRAMADQKLVEMRKGLNVDAAPAALIEEEGVVVEEGVMRADVDKGAGVAGEEPVQENVFHVLSVGNTGRRAG